jgi:hypothetical protein
MTALLFFALSAGLLLALLWLLFGRRTPSMHPTAAALELQKFLPVHYRHFPQIQPLLNPVDEEFMSRRAPRSLAKRWRAERRQILWLYIRGLAQDFRGLEQLARLLAALSPEIKRKQEWEWLWLSIQFRVLCTVTLLRFTAHDIPTEQLIRLTEMLSGLRMTLENSIRQMTDLVPKQQEA